MFTSKNGFDKIEMHFELCLSLKVKEMEGIIRRRHPNSLPALIMTAAITPDDQTKTEKTPTAVVLENRVKKLEAELESKDSESDRMLRAVEQKYHNVKVGCRLNSHRCIFILSSNNTHMFNRGKCHEITI